MPITPEPVDLTAMAVTTRLLAEPRAWRERAVERLDVGSAQFIRRRRTLQVRRLRPLLGQAPASASYDTALLVLPLATLPKRPLIDLDLHGPTGDLVLLRRPEVAEREAALVEHYAEEAGLPIPPLVDGVVPTLLGFTDGAWRDVRAESGSVLQAEQRYLEQGLDQPVHSSLLVHLTALGERAATALDRHVDVPTSETSALERPLLIVPPLVEQGLVRDLDQAVDALEQYVAWLEGASRAAEHSRPSAAGDLLSVLADYGRHWELMVFGEFPLDRPFVVGFEHLDAVPVKGRRNMVRPSVVIADADSNHVTLRSTDSGTRLSHVKAVHPRTGRVAEMGSTSLQTQELHSFYVWEVDVDYRVVLEARLSVLRRTALGVATLASLVLLVAMALVVKPPDSLAGLALTAGPAAAVAGSLLLREPSTLASRLRLPYTVSATAALVLLAGVTVWRFLTLP